MTVSGSPERYVIRLAGNDTHLLGISREVEYAATVAAAGVGVGPEVTAFIRPEGYLVTRFIEGSPVPIEQVREPDTIERVADALRRIHDGPPIPGLFVPLRIVEAYRALAQARGVRIPPEYELAAAIGRRIELACLADPVELRPCHNDLLNANFIDDGARIRIVDWEYAGMGDPYFDLGNFSINHELTPDDDANLLGDVSRLRSDRPPRSLDPDAHRLGLPRGDVGRPPAGHQHARCRFRGLRRRALRSPAGERYDAGIRAVPARGGRRLTDVPGPVYRSMMSVDQARVVVIGGGITGCSVAYHLAEAGWTDVLLVEKAQLTAGATYMAAGLVTAFNPSSTMMGFRRYSIGLYGRLGAFERVGSLRLASSREQLGELQRSASRARGIGLEAEVIGPEEARRLMPAISPTDLYGAVHLAGRRSSRPARDDACPR